MLKTKRLDRWLMKPQANARESLGIFRIVFGLGYLWFILSRNNQELWSQPDAQWEPIALLERITSPPSASVFQILLIGLIVSLVVLIIGVKTRWASLGVVIFGMGFAALRYSYGYMPHYSLFMEAYIPLTMLFSRWGDAYSWDATRLNPETLPSNDSWHYTWQNKIILLLLVITFVSSGFVKFVEVGFWENPDQMRNILLVQAVNTTIYGFPDNSLVVDPLLDMPFITQMLRFVAIGFEGFFWLALLNRRWRNFFIVMAFGFNWFNAIFLNIYFTQMLLTYILFVDLYQWRRALFPTMIGATLFVAGFALFEPLTELHQPVRIGAWYVLTPVVILVGAITTLDLIRPWLPFTSSTQITSSSESTTQ